MEFVVNAPYPDIVARLGRASIGLNTMQDEHFGINIVEFMVRRVTRCGGGVSMTDAQAAGLIPIVHASAGPLMDIVVPLNGQTTGTPACTPSLAHRRLPRDGPRLLRRRDPHRPLSLPRSATRDPPSGPTGGDFQILRSGVRARFRERVGGAPPPSPSSTAVGVEGLHRMHWLITLYRGLEVRVPWSSQIEEISEPAALRITLRVVTSR